MRTDFLIELIRRRIIDRYIGAGFGMAWVFVSPLIPLITNVAVFYFIAQIPQVQSMGLAAYTAFMFTGLLPFQLLQKSSRESCELLIGNMDILKTAVFPLPFLSLSTVGAMAFEFLIQCSFLLVLLVIAGAGLGWQILLFPIPVLLIFMLALGLSWMLSIAGYLLRDLQEIVTVLFSALLYATPIVYPADAGPPILQTLIKLNPLTYYVVMFRDVVLPGNEGLHAGAWALSCLISMAVLAAGWISIRAAQQFVGDMV